VICLYASAWFWVCVSCVGVVVFLFTGCLFLVGFLVSLGLLWVCVAYVVYLFIVVWFWLLVCMLIVLIAFYCDFCFVMDCFVLILRGVVYLPRTLIELNSCKEIVRQSKVEMWAAASSSDFQTFSNSKSLCWLKLLFGVSKYDTHK